MAIDDLASVQEQVTEETILDIKCEPSICGAACCHNQVVLNLYDVGRLIDAGHKEGITNIPDPRGRPDSYFPVLKKENGKCIFLSDELRCEIYEHRPDICRVYPYTKNPGCRFSANLTSEEKVEIKANIESHRKHIIKTVGMLNYDCEGLEELGLLKYFTSKL